MHRNYGLAIAAATLILVPASISAQATMSEDSRKVAGGGVMIPGWTGKVDANEAAKGLKLEDAKLMKMGNDMHVVTGPAITYWSNSNKAAGDYTVKATFREDKYMSLNDHPHPYGIVIAGNDLGTDQASYLYCSAYGNGTYIVRGFGPTAFQLGGRRATAAPSVNKAAGPGQSVTQEIAISVKSGKVDCIINGATVASYTKAEVVMPGRLKSTDGVFGVRFAHNTEAVVSGFTMTKH